MVRRFYSLVFFKDVGTSNGEKGSVVIYANEAELFVLNAFVNKSLLICTKKGSEPELTDAEPNGLFYLVKS